MLFLHEKGFNLLFSSINHYKFMSDFLYFPNILKDTKDLI